MSDLDRQLFGERLRLYRMSAGLSVAELAKRAQTARQVVYEIEGGKANYTIDHFTRLLRACGVSLDEFVRGANPESAQDFELFQMLRIVISSQNPDLLQGLRVSLEALSEKALRLMKTRASPVDPESRDGMEGLPARGGHRDGQSKRKKKPA